MTIYLGFLAAGDGLPAAAGGAKSIMSILIVTSRCSLPRMNASDGPAAGEAAAAGLAPGSAGGGAPSMPVGAAPGCSVPGGGPLRGPACASVFLLTMRTREQWC